MDFPQVDATVITGTAQTERPVQRDEATLRRMASEFEALLLNQLTASLNPKEEDEEGLFTNSGGMGLSRQMFSEQLAKTMSEHGGIGLADLIISHLKGNAPSKKSPETSRALAAAREIRAHSGKALGQESASSAATNNSGDVSSDSTADSTAAPLPEARPFLSISTPANVAPVSSVSSADVSRATRPRRIHEIESGPRASVDNSIVSSGPASAAGAEENPPKLLRNHVALNLPVRGIIRSGFGPRRDPINGRHRFHQGIDIVAARGTPIEAAADGKVVFAGRNKGYGNMVMVEHADGRRTIYAHAERLFVKTGATVAAGQTIAAVGSTGHSTGPHLHFEIRESNRPLNPLTVLANDLRVARR